MQNDSAGFDALVIGAGLAGAVAAGELARRGGLRVLVLEKRPHVGGNVYDCLDEQGILIHKYGPHIFHTNLPRVYEYLSKYTEWLDYQHEVVANLPDEARSGERMEYPVPFNLDSMEIAFGPEKGKALGEKLMATYGAERKVTILELRQNPDPEIAALAQYVYDHVFVKYTMKQWGKRPEEIDPETTARVPVFLSRDRRYFQDTWQGMPTDGFTPMCEKILDHPKIRVETDTDASAHLELVDGKTLLDGTAFSGPVVYTGPVDELFGLRFGRLPYRTLDFRFETHPMDYYQSHAVLNYTVDEPFTRITEFKRLTGQEKPGATTILKEYSRTYTGAAGEVPCYAIRNPENLAQYARYRELAGAYPNLHLLGRLAEYQYYNMDVIAARALELADALCERRDNA